MQCNISRQTAVCGIVHHGLQINLTSEFFRLLYILIHIQQTSNTLVWFAQFSDIEKFMHGVTETSVGIKPRRLVGGILINVNKK